MINVIMSELLPENMDMVSSGRSWANCLDRKRCERQ